MSRKPSLRDALDASLSRMLRGESISQCIYHYPQYERELRPLLEAALVLRRVPVPEARPEAVQEGYARMMAAVRAKRRRLAAEEEAKPERVGLLSVLRSRSSVRWLVMSGVALLLLLLIGFGWVWQAGDFTTALLDPVAVTVTEVEGTVLRLPAGSQRWMSAMAGDAVATGDRLRTLADAKASVSVGPDHAMSLAATTELELVALPTRWNPTRSPRVYQVVGTVRYRVAMGDGLSRGPSALGAALFGADFAAAAPMTDTLAQDDSGEVHFDVQSPTLEVRAVHAQFLVTVAEDGSTSVVVEEGQVNVAAGGQTLVVDAGHAVSIGAGGTGLQVTEVDLASGDGDAADSDTGQEDAPEPTSTEDVPKSPTLVPRGGLTPTPVPGEVGDTPADIPGGEPGTGDDGEPPDEGGDTVPPQPPGLKDRDVPGDPPGLEDREGEPPGHQDGGPPGLDGKDVEPNPAEATAEVEPDAEIEPEPEPPPAHQPPGLEDGDGVPPGLEDKGGAPPGQGDKGKDE